MFHQNRETSVSFEGYDQCICEKGHLFTTPHWGDRVCECGAFTAFFNSVDDTNCDQYGTIIDWSSLLIEGEKTETCPCCKHTKTVDQARYRIPTDAELKKLRLRRETDDQGNDHWVNIEDYKAVTDVVEG